MDAKTNGVLAETLLHAASRWEREAKYLGSGIDDGYSAGQRHAFQSCALELRALLAAPNPDFTP